MRLKAGSSKQAPAQRFAGMEWDQAGNVVGHVGFGLLQSDRAFVQRQSVETRAVFGRERFEIAERVLFGEHAGIAFERKRRVEYPSAAARRFLGLTRVRC